MGERTVSGWFILSAVFIVLVFGLFFTFTERKTWPEHKVELGPMDMRLMPTVSTLWCEAVALHSDHSFVAYQVNYSTQVNPFRLSYQNVNIQMKLGGSWSTNSVKFKYFLLPFSVASIVACSSSPAVKLLIFKGDLNVQNCLQSLAYKGFSKSPDESDEDTSEDSDSDEEDDLPPDMDFKKSCSSLLYSHPIDSTYIDDYSMECTTSTESHPFKMNITSADYYVIAVWNTDRHVPNNVNLQVRLDRTRYVAPSSGQTLGICSLSNSCTIGLGFASGDRVLVSVPEEPNSGRSSFVIRSRCKPRLAVFAVLSVFLPLLLFLAVAFVVRSDRDALGRFFCKTNRDASNHRLSNRQRFVRPLLDDRNTAAESLESLSATENRTSAALIDDRPPAYHTLYDPPPPYTCLKTNNAHSQASR